MHYDIAYCSILRSGPSNISDSLYSYFVLRALIEWHARAIRLDYFFVKNRDSGEFDEISERYRKAFSSRDAKGVLFIELFLYYRSTLIKFFYGLFCPYSLDEKKPNNSAN